jgi:hypothetical protein
MPNQELIQDVLTRTSDVILGKQKNAKSESDFIYHVQRIDVSVEVEVENLMFLGHIVKKWEQNQC